MSAITDAFVQNESRQENKMKKKIVNISRKKSISALAHLWKRDYFVFGSYESTTNIALFRDFLLAIISPGVPPVFPPPHAHFFFVQGQCVPGHFQAFFLCSWLRSCIRVSKTWRDDVKCVLLDVLWTLLCSDASLESGAIMMEWYHMGKPIPFISSNMNQKVIWNYYHAHRTNPEFPRIL